jgi:16S rRNA C1402 N4-methylase RsmH
MRLTHKAHAIISHYLQEGQLAVDATAGNGHDTLFLARRVGAAGRVFAFDIQKQALRATSARLEQAGLSSRVELIHDGHEHMAESLPPDSHGRLRAVMFNLGYLPHSDKATTTRVEHTLPALEQARRLLTPGGVISVLAYRGHPGGREESQAVKDALTGLAGGLQLSILESPGPVLMILAPDAHE